MTRLKILKHGERVSFRPIDTTAPTPGESYGRAEFSFCLQWFRGRVKHVHIHHLQQRDVRKHYRVDPKHSTSFAITSWSHQGIFTPDIWMYSHCTEHKCTCMRCYVPTNSDYFEVQELSTTGIYFGHSSKGLV